MHCLCRIWLSDLKLFLYLLFYISLYDVTSSYWPIISHRYNVCRTNYFDQQVSISNALRSNSDMKSFTVDFLCLVKPWWSRKSMVEVVVFGRERIGLDSCFGVSSESFLFVVRLKLNAASTNRNEIKLLGRRVQHFPHLKTSDYCNLVWKKLLFKSIRRLTIEVSF